MVKLYIPTFFPAKSETEIQAYRTLKILSEQEYGRMHDRFMDASTEEKVEQTCLDLERGLSWHDLPKGPASFGATVQSLVSHVNGHDVFGARRSRQAAMQSFKSFYYPAAETMEEAEQFASDYAREMQMLFDNIYPCTGNVEHLSEIRGVSGFREIRELEVKKGFRSATKIKTSTSPSQDREMLNKYSELKRFLPDCLHLSNGRYYILGTSAHKANKISLCSSPAIEGFSAEKQSEMEITAKIQQLRTAFHQKAQMQQIYDFQIEPYRQGGVTYEQARKMAHNARDLQVLREMGVSTEGSDINSPHIETNIRRHVEHNGKVPNTSPLNGSAIAGAYGRVFDLG